jgi:60 kDa SS-A/Ro ribonucleoprotein
MPWPITEYVNPGSNTVAAWAVGKLDPLVPESCTPGGFLDPIVGLEKVKRATAVKEVVKLIQDYRLVREVVPTEHLNSPEVWEALLEEMPVTAMIRNLGKMTQVGLLKPLSAATKKVVERLQSRERFKSARVHPMSVLLALRTYQKGHGDKGKLSWEPVGSVVSALDDAFYHAFYGVEPTYKNWLIGLDVSGSMSSPIINSCLSCCEAAAALSLVTLATEPWTEVMGFCDSFVKLGLTKGMRLDTALQKTSRLNFGRTDCSLPMVYAADRKLEVDVFLVITDNETYAGSVHPYQALANYRQKMGRPAKLIVMGMTATNFSIADPSDAGMLDVIGMDSTAPQVMADFARS